MLSKLLVDIEGNAGQTPCIPEENALKWWVFLTVLEDKMLTVFTKIGCELFPRGLKACHQLRKNSNKVKVKFSRCKDYEQIAVEKDWKSKNAGYWANRQSIYICK